MPTGFIGTIVVGAIIGWLASIIAKTNDQMGCLWNVAVGVVGAGLGSWLAAVVFDYHVMQGFSIPGFFIGVAGAVALILVLRFFGILRR